MDEFYTNHLQKQKQKFFSKNLRSMIKKQTEYANASLGSQSHLNEIISILSKDCMFRSKEESNIVALAVRQTKFYTFYEKEFIEIPSALRMIVEGMTYEQFHPCQKICTEKEKAKKVYIILSGEVCIYSQYLKKDRFKNESINENKHSGENKLQVDENKCENNEYQQSCDDNSDRLNNEKADALMYEKLFANHYSQLKVFQLLNKFNFFGDTDVRHKSKYSLSAVAKSNVHCAVIPCDLFTNYLDPQYVEHCLRYSEQMTYSIGSVIFKEGERSCEVYYIKQGEIEQSTKKVKIQSENSTKLKEISVNMKSMNKDFHDDVNDDENFDTEKFLKSNLFNQTLYEKGGPVRQSRQFWNQKANGDDIDFVEKLKKEIDQGKIILQKQGIKHTKIELEDQVKKFMVQSTSKKLENKSNHNSFLNKATNDTQSSGLKLSLVSVGSYFGEEVLSSHPLIAQQKRENGEINSSFLKIDCEMKGSNSQKQRNSIQLQKFSDMNIKKNKDCNFEGETNQEEEKQNERSKFRQYTVKCKSSSCLLLKMSMEIFLSFTFLNQKEEAAQKFLQSEVKQQRRDSKIETHVHLIQTSKLVSPQDALKQRNISIFSDKIIEFIQGNNVHSHQTLDSSPMQREHKGNNSSERNKADDRFTQSPKQNTSLVNRISISQINTNEKEEEGLREQIKASYYNSPSGQTSIQAPQFKSDQLIDASTPTNSQKKNSMFFTKSSVNSQQRTMLPLQNQKLHIDLKRKRGLLINYGNSNNDNVICSESRVIQSGTPTHSQKPKEMSEFAQTLSQIIEKEEKRQKQISLMTNSLEKQPKLFSLQDSYKNSPLISPNLSNRFLGEIPKESNYNQVSNSPMSCKQKNYFFRPNYSETNVPQRQNVFNYRSGQKTFQQGNQNNGGNLEQSTEEFSYCLNLNSKNSMNPSLSEIKKNQLPHLLNNTSTSIGSYRNSLSKSCSQQQQYLSQIQPTAHPLGVNLIIGTDHQANNLLKESKNKSIGYQNIIQQLMKNNEVQQVPLINFSSAHNYLTKREGKQETRQIPHTFQTIENKVFPCSPTAAGENNTYFKSRFVEGLRIYTEQDNQQDLEEEEKEQPKPSIQQKQKILQPKMEKTSCPVPQPYILKPLLNEIIQSEKNKKEKEEHPEKEQRVNIQIFGDFYIKKYRKAYKEAYNSTQRQSKPSFQSIFISSGQTLDKKQKLSEEEMSLLFLKKHQIEKKFPNSDRAKKVNEFFTKKVQQIEAYHKDEMIKMKRSKDVNQITANELMRQMEQQYQMQEKEKDFAATHFNFVFKDINENTPQKSNKKTSKAKIQHILDFSLPK